MLESPLLCWCLGTGAKILAAAEEEKGMLTFYSVDENGEYLLVDGEKVIHPIGEP